MANKKESGGSRKIGRNRERSPACARYRSGQRRIFNKVKRVARSSGVEAAKLYVKEATCDTKRNPFCHMSGVTRINARKVIEREIERQAQ